MRTRKRRSRRHVLLVLVEEVPGRFGITGTERYGLPATTVHLDFALMRCRTFRFFVVVSEDERAKNGRACVADHVEFVEGDVILAW